MPKDSISTLSNTNTPLDDNPTSTNDLEDLDHQTDGEELQEEDLPPDVLDALGLQDNEGNTTNTSHKGPKKPQRAISNQNAAIDWLPVDDKKALEQIDSLY